MEFLEQEIFNNTVLDYLATLIIIVIGVLVVAFIRTYIIHRLEKKADDAKTKFDKFLIVTLGKTIMPALIFGVIYLSVQHLSLNNYIDKMINAAGIVVLTFFGIRFIMSILRYALELYWIGRVDEDTKKRNVKSVMPIAKVLIYGVGLFFLLDNLGFNVSTLIAGLGIGGVAVALAGQAILADLFSYFAILFDKPFEIGDFIIVDTHMGVVEKTGIKTTRVKSLSGEQLIFSNKDLTNSRVKNYKRMEERRVSFKLGLIYQTAADHLKEVPGLIKDIVENIPKTRFDRTHFCEYGDFSLNFEIVYYIYGSDFNLYMDIQQRMNLEIFEAFGKRGIEFAYPSQTLFLNKEG
jgi:small-conductance mechanosensitive channel